LPLLLSLLFKFTNVCPTVDASFRMLYPDWTACQYGNECGCAGCLVHSEHFRPARRRTWRPVDTHKVEPKIQHRGRSCCSPAYCFRRLPFNSTRTRYGFLPGKANTLPSEDKLDENIQIFCENLVYFDKDNNTVGLIHQSTKEYLNEYFISHSAMACL
jgi:hypothetical protein